MEQITETSAAPDDKVELLIPEPRLRKFEKKIESLNRRAGKLGLTPLVLVRLGKVVKEVKQPGLDGKEKVLARYHYEKMLLQGARPKLNGWTLLGTISHESGGNVLQSAPDQEIPES